MSVSPIDSYSLSSSAKKKGFSNCFVYRGLSMTPTFQNGDFLFLRSVVENNLFLGDVIVFSYPKNKKYFVHRIVAFSNKYFITRGDHCLSRDVLPITLGDIVGKVELVENRRGIVPVVNGAFGLWMARIWHSVFLLDHIIRRLFWMPYNFLRDKQLAVIFWHPEISRIYVQSKNTTKIKYIYKNHTVATWEPSRQYFDCCKPFDLVIPPPSKDAKSRF